MNRKKFRFTAIFTALFSFSTALIYIRGNFSEVKATSLSDEALVDNAVYFIKPYLNQDKSLDVSGANYEDGANIIAYDFLGWGNQRFVLEKSYGDTFRIRPLDSINSYLCVNYSSNIITQRNQIVLKTDGNYINTNELFGDRFIFEYSSEKNAYKIATKISGGLKYLSSSQYNSYNDNDYIIQKSFSSYNGDYFYWTFERTNDLGTNVKNSFTLYSYEEREFLINNRYSLDYKILAHSLSLRKFEVSILTDYPDSNLIYRSNIPILQFANSFNFVNSSTYILKIKNKSSLPNTIELGMLPLKQFVCSSMFDYNGQDDPSRDTTSVYLNLNTLFTNSGYYPSIFTNVIPSTINKVKVDGRYLFNSDIFVSDSHGNAGGVVYQEQDNATGICEWIDVINMPSFEGTQLSIWNSCNSGTVSVNHNNSGITASLAEMAAINGSQYSIGFDGGVRFNISACWITEFFQKYLYYNIPELYAAGIACAHSRTTFPTYTDDGIFYTKVYINENDTVNCYDPISLIITLLDIQCTREEFNDPSIFIDDEYNVVHLYNEEGIITNIPLSEKEDYLSANLYIDDEASPDRAILNDNDIFDYYKIISKNEYITVFDYQNKDYISLSEFSKRWRESYEKHFTK